LVGVLIGALPGGSRGDAAVALLIAAVVVKEDRDAGVVNTVVHTATIRTA
jgi:hypothetical protein